MAAYKLVSGGSGVVRTADGAFIPNDPGNADWSIYQEWLAVPNVPDPVLLPSLADYKAAGKASVREEAEGRRQTAWRIYPVDLLRFVEARLAVPDGTPTAAEYPLLAAQATAESQTIEVVAANVVGEELDVREAWAPVEEALRTGLLAIDAATTNAEVDTAVAAIAWP